MSEQNPKPKAEREQQAVSDADAERAASIQADYENTVAWNEEDRANPGRDT